MIDSLKGEYLDLFKSIFNDADNGICIVDYEGNIVEVNHIYADMFGYHHDELIGKHYSVLMSGDSLHTVENNHLKIFNGTNILKAEEKVKHKNGTCFYVQTTNLRVNDEFGNKLRITTAVDITNRLRNELVQSVLLKISNLTNLSTPNEELYTSIHSAVSQLLPIKNFAVCVKNKINQKLEFPYILDETNNTETKNLEIEHQFVESSGFPILLDSESFKNQLSKYDYPEYNPIPTSFVGIPVIVKGEILGSLLIKNYSGIPFKNEDVELLDLVGSQVGRVIERKNYEEELVNARLKAEEAVKIKSEFLAQISHEIRTPLNSILSFSSLIKSELDGALTPELKETFNYIERGGNRLTRTIDLILNVSKSQNNQYKITLEELDLVKEILEPLKIEFERLSKLKSIELELEYTSDDFRLVCDHYSVNQLFANLIENAIKYTNKGSVVIKVLKNELGKIQVDIKDTGIGVSLDYIPKLFDPFTQEEQGYTRSYEGIGLGLSLVKNYAELNHAEVKVATEKNKGSVFSVIFN